MADYTPAPNGMFGNIAQNGQNGMLGGYLQSLSNEFSLRQQQDAIRGRDLGFLEDMRKYQMNQDDDVVHRADNQNKLSAAGDLASQYSEGIPQKAARDAAATGLVQNEGKRDDVRMKQLHNAGEALDDINTEMGNRQLDPTKQSDLDTWQDWRQRGLKAGIDIGAAPTPEGQASIKAKANSYYNSAVFRQKTAMETQKTTSAESIAKGHDTTSRYVADQNRLSRDEVASIRNERPTPPQDQNRVVLAEVREKAKRTGVVTEDDVDQVEMAQGTAFAKLWEVKGEAVKKDEKQKLLAMGPQKFMEYKKAHDLPLDATAEDVANITKNDLEGKYAKAAALKFLGNPRVVPSDKADAPAPSAPAPGAPPSAAPSASKNTDLIAKMKVRYPKASDQQIIDSLKAAKKWVE
jgi:hypothetical protein